MLLLSPSQSWKGNLKISSSDGHRICSLLFHVLSFLEELLLHILSFAPISCALSKHQFWEKGWNTFKYESLENWTENKSFDFREEKIVVLQMFLVQKENKIFQNV